jgi:addiction module HigA family antidote
MNLTDREKEQLKAMIDAGRPLPPPYKADLFDQRHKAKLIWPAKSGEVANAVLPVHPHNRVTQITHGRRGVTGDTALRLGNWFGASAQFWLKLQSAYDIRVAEEKAGSFRPARQIPLGISRSSQA